MNESGQGRYVMENYIGQILLGIWHFAPKGTAFCQGQLISIHQNTTLYALIGTSYGGDGRTTFALPDLRARSPIGFGYDGDFLGGRMGAKFGSETAKLSAANLPAHHHAVKGMGAASTASIRSGSNPISVPATDGNTEETGRGYPFSIRSPSLVLNYVIVLDGIFPSRT